MSSPCQNGGTCVANHKYHTFDCRCKEGFYGEFCEGNWCTAALCISSRQHKSLSLIFKAYSQVYNVPTIFFWCLFNLLWCICKLICLTLKSRFLSRHHPAKTDQVEPRAHDRRSLNRFLFNKSCWIPPPPPPHKFTCRFLFSPPLLLFFLRPFLLASFWEKNLKENWWRHKWYKKRG